MLNHWKARDFVEKYRLQLYSKNVNIVYRILCGNLPFRMTNDSLLESKTAIHIGILDFDPFRETDNQSRLYESYRLMSQETQRIYTDKFRLSILCLPALDRVQEEEVSARTRLWAQYFKAKTWEDLKMLAAKDESIASAVNTANALMEDEEVRARMEARADYYRRVNTEKEKLRIAQEQAAVFREKLLAAEERIKVLEEELKTRPPTDAGSGGES